MNNKNLFTIGEIAKAVGYTKTKTLRIIDTLKEKEYVKVLGNGRGTKYSL